MASNLQNLLSSLRSPIFHTLHNPTCARMGTKYLRARLRGPAVASYYPQLTNPFPKISAVTKRVPENPFAGWEGRPLPRTFKQRKGKEVVVQQNVVWKSEGTMLPASQVVDKGFVEVRRKKGMGWLADPTVEKKKAKATARRKAGKGPPSKGHGKRSQVKK